MPAKDSSDECELVLLGSPAPRSGDSDAQADAGHRRDLPHFSRPDSASAQVAGRAGSTQSAPGPSDTSHAASPAQFDIVVRSHGERKVIAVAGEIDCSTAPALHGTLHRLLAEGHHDLGVDLGSVTFMDGSVLTFLLTARRAVTARGGSSTIIGHNRLLTRLLQATGLTDVFNGN